MYKSITAAAILGITLAPSYAAIGDGKFLKQMQETERGDALDRDVALDRDGEILDLIDGELDLDLEMPEPDDEAMAERIQTGKEIRACADTLDVSGASTAIQQYINQMAESNDGVDFELGTVLEELDIDTSEASGTMFALYKVWSEETEEETEARREARRESQVDEYVTEECQVAFSAMSEGVTGLMAGEDEEESTVDECYQFVDGDISVELCMNDAVSSSINEEEYVTVSGVLSNKGGVGLCNVTFDIMDLESAVETTPVSLPKVPGVFQPESEFVFSATVPVDPESHVAPYVDVWNTFYACNEASVEEEEEEEVVEEEEEEEEEEEVEEREPVVTEPENPIDLEEWITPETMCFYGCYDALIKKFGSESALTECPTLEFLLTNEANCHRCDPFVVQATKEKCVDFGCSEAQCAVKANTKTSGASKNTISMAFVAAAAGAIAFMN